MKRRKIIPFAILLLLCLGLSFGFTIQYKFSRGMISGTIEGKDSTIVKLSYHYNGRDMVSTAVLIGNQFDFNVIFPEPVICTLSNSVNQQIRIFIAQNRRITLSGVIDKFHALKITNAVEHDLFEGFKAKTYQLSGEYRKALDVSGGDRKDRKNPIFLRYRNRVDSLTLDFVKKNNESTAAALAIIDSYLNDSDRKKAGIAYVQLSLGAKNGIYAKRIKQFIDTEVLIQKGNLAPTFTLNDISGKPVKLTDFRGRYVLLDFWASWCPPCRAEHPLLIELQRKYAKDIDFVSISMDASATSWKQAVQVDKLTWTQLNDPKSTNGEVADSYGFKALPFNCIVDPEGKIVATKLRGHNLESFLSKLFDKTEGR